MNKRITTLLITLIFMLSNAFPCAAAVEALHHTEDVYDFQQGGSLTEEDFFQKDDTENGSGTTDGENPILVDVDIGDTEITEEDDFEKTDGTENEDGLIEEAVFEEEPPLEVSLSANMAEQYVADEQELRQILMDLQDGETVDVILTDDIYLGDNSIVSYNAGLGDGFGEDIPLIINNDNVTINFKSDVSGITRTLYRIDKQRHFVILGTQYDVRQNVTLTFTDVELNGLLQYDPAEVRYNQPYDSSCGGILVHCADNTAIKGLVVKDCFAGVYMPDRFEGIPDENGGAINFLSCNGVQLEDSVFEENVTASVGGALAFLSGDNVDIENCTFRGNSSNRAAEGGRGGAITIDGYGLNPNTSFLIDSCSFIDNIAISHALASFRSDIDIPTVVTAPDYGGAVAVYGCPASLTITGNTEFRGNIANYGGGILFAGAYDTNKLTIDGTVTFYGNQALNEHHVPKPDQALTQYNHAYGGGIFINSGAAATIKGNVTFENNTVKAVNSRGLGGGMVTVKALDLSGNVRFINNEAKGSGVSDYGGGLYLQAPLTATGDQIVFEGNKAAWGGALYANLGSTSDIANLDETVFRKNQALGGGAAIYVSMANYERLFCKDVTFSGNHTTVNRARYLEVDEPDFDQAAFDAIAATYNNQITGTKSLSEPFDLAYGEYAYNNYDIYLNQGAPAPVIIINYYEDSVADENLLGTEKVPAGRRSVPNVVIASALGGFWKDLWQPIGYDNGILVDPLPNDVGKEDVIVSVLYGKKVPPTYSIEAAPSNLTFVSVTEGYVTPHDVQTVTVRNIGTGTVTLEQPLSTDFVIGSFAPSATLGAGDTATFTVQPKADLSAGTYSETIQIKGNNGASDWITASFEVHAPFTAEVLPGLVTVLPNETGTFTAYAAGGDGSYTYQWQWKDEYGTWNQMPGETSAMLTVSRSSAGTYEFQCLVEDGTGATATAACTLQVVLAPVPVLNVKAPEFDQAEAGYAPVHPKNIVIENKGNAAATIQQVTVTGDFSIVTTPGTMNGVAVNGSNDTWQVQPDTSLLPDVYTGIITVTYDDNRTATAEVTFVVTAPVSGPVLAVTAPTFNQVKVGYKQQEPKAIGIQNMGNAAATIEKVEVTGAFAIVTDADTSNAVAVNESNNTWWVRPNDNLSVGTHKGTVTVTYDGNKIAAAPLEFIVTSSTAGGGGGSSNSSSYVVQFDSGGGSPVDSQSINSGAKVKVPADPIREDYLFSGWYTNPDLATLYDFDKAVNSSFTLYAGWDLVERLSIPEMHYAYISGYPDGSFKPEGRLTRAETATMLYHISLRDGITREDRIAVFSDVDESNWYYDAVSKLGGWGIISGYGDGSFGPDKTITRAEFVALAMRYTGIPSSGDHSFPDVPAGHWAAGNITAAVNAGHISGYPNGTFGPEQNITRAEAVAILNHTIGCIGIEDGNTFLDMQSSHWAYKDITGAATDHHHE